MGTVTATLLGALIGGLIGVVGSVIGSLVGLLGPRYLRTRGNIRMRTSRWELKPLENNPTTYAYKLSIFAFNDMELNTAAQDIHVLLRKQGAEEPLTCTPKDALSNFRIDSLDLPSRSPVNRDVYGEIQIERLKERFGEPFNEQSISAVELKGSWPTGEPITHEVFTDGRVNEEWRGYKQWTGPWYKRVFLAKDPMETERPRS